MLADEMVGLTEFCEHLDPAEARRIPRRLEFHYIPRHASWLNMVEIEIGVMVAQCLDPRISDKSTLALRAKRQQRPDRRNVPEGPEGVFQVPDQIGDKPVRTNRSTLLGHVRQIV